MRVRTLDDKDFKVYCCQLAGLVIGSGYQPDLVVGIANGGVRVMDELIDSGIFRGNSSVGVKRVVVRRQRPGTVAKQRLAGKFLAHIPRWSANILRRIESAMRGIKSRLIKPEVSELILDESVVQALSDASNILIVDDAVDTGATLAAVKRSVEKVTAATVRTAVITVTLKNPLIFPDYHLIAELIRFPWSVDNRR